MQSAARSTARVTRSDVLNAARQCFLDHGYDGTTLAEIGARIGVSPAALLRHEPTKSALFGAALHSYVMIHKVAELFEKPVPLGLYLDTLLDIWTRGAILKGHQV